MTTIGAVHVGDSRLADYRSRWRVRELAVFGSVARGEHRADSDIDILVSFDDDAPWDLADVLDAKRELSEIVGCPIDMVERAAVETNDNWLPKQEVPGSAKVVHART